MFDAVTAKDVGVWIVNRLEHDLAVVQASEGWVVHCVWHGRC